ncbi:UvrD-helicase domain-containing protein [Myxococcota bacterium]|nr:UvrD-helicase domain-containing protein [Myxococcota bacterium]
MSEGATLRPAPADAAARRVIRDALDTTLVVEAAAGTGKTTALVGRIVALLTSGRATLGGIISVTFTDKAAGEMKLRLRAEIEKARTAAREDATVHARLDRALAELETARIGTIHSLCADLLRERPIEARVDPLFEIAAQDDVRRIYGAAFDEWFQAVLAHPPEGVRRVLRRRPRGRGLETPRELLFDDGRRLAVELRDFDAPWSRRPIDRVAEIDRAIAALTSLEPLAELCVKSTDYLAKSLQELVRVVADVRHRETVRARDYDALEAQLREVLWMRAWKWEGRGDWVVRGVLRRSEVLDRRAVVRAVLEDVVAKLDADLAACLRSDLAPLVAAYDRHKRRAGKLDFLDLLLRTRDLVRDHDDVRAELQARFSHVLVDEFQDTDPLQAEILLLLAANDGATRDWTRAVPHAGKLFVVGDPKQSIYRFRRADVALYEDVKRRLLTAGAQLVHLSTSFRGRPELQSAINAAFAPLMTGSADGSQAEYVALEAVRTDREDQPAIVALPAPRPYTEWGKIANWRVEESLPDAVGAFVDWLVRDSGWRVTEREDPDRLVPIEARHVCLLFKRLTSGGEDVSREYVRALEVRRIPHVLVGGRSFHEREEVLAMKSALVAIEWPDDELAVYATLRGPFFALGDDKLLAYRHALRTLHPLVRRDPSEVEAPHLPRRGAGRARPARGAAPQPQLAPDLGHDRALPRRDARARWHRDLAVG